MLKDRDFEFPKFVFQHVEIFLGSFGRGSYNVFGKWFTHTYNTERNLQRM